MSSTAGQKLLEEYFIRVAEVNLQQPHRKDQVREILDISLNTAAMMVRMIEGDARPSTGAVHVPDVIFPFDKPMLTNEEANALGGILRYGNDVRAGSSVALLDHLRAAGLISVGGSMLTEGGLAVLAKHCGLRPMSEAPDDDRDILVLGFIEGVWCQTISSRDDRSFRRGYLNSKGASWASFWSALPGTPEWAAPFLQAKKAE